MSAERLMGLIFAALCLLGVAYFAGRIVQDWIELDQLRQAGVSAEAKVTWYDQVLPLISIGSDTDRSSREYQVTYRFSAEGKQFNRDEVVSPEIYSRVKIGSVVAIRYVRHNPAISRIVGNEAPRPNNAIQILLLLFLFFLCLFVPPRLSASDDS